MEVVESAHAESKNKRHKQI